MQGEERQQLPLAQTPWGSVLRKEIVQLRPPASPGLSLGGRSLCLVGAQRRTGWVVRGLW